MSLIITNILPFPHLPPPKEKKKEEISIELNTNLGQKATLLIA